MPHLVGGMRMKKTGTIKSKPTMIKMAAPTPSQAGVLSVPSGSACTSVAALSIAAPNVKWRIGL